MSDPLDTVTITEPAERPIDRPNGAAPVLDLAGDNGETAPRIFTEQEARDFLAAFAAGGMKVPSRRDLAAQWGWHRSSVQRFLSRIESETKRETPAEIARETPIAESGPQQFDWCNDSDVLIDAQPSTAIYENAAGHIVIGQEGSVYDDDPYVVIAPEYLERVLTRLAEFRKGGGR